MPRPRCQCRIGHQPTARYFKPRGIPMAHLQEIRLAPEELEAVRWADLQGCYHAQAAQHMRISRATFGRILETGRRKIAQALVEGHALCLTAHNAEPNPQRKDARKRSTP